MSTPQQVDEFLLSVRSLIDSRSVVIVPRDKNQEGMLNLGLTQASALASIRMLDRTNYCRGPEADRDRPGQECWVFGFNCGTAQAYVKLVNEELAGGRRRLKILSIHPAEHPIRYRFA